MMSKCYFIIIVLFLFFSCSEKKESTFKILYKNSSGIDFENILTPSDSLNILDYLYFYNGAGVAVGDINNDGLPDIYFSGNMVKNRLYLNKGNMKFEDITNASGVYGKSDWNTGVVMADVNADGYLDIYVCAVVGIHGLKGHNELFINNGDTTFTEKSKEFGLDFENYSTSTAFFDYDLDGDLDMYLLNHAVHNESSFGKSSIRFNRNIVSGDKLLRNDNGKFIDVSEKSGILGGANGYGLGIAILDFNQDNFPDIYISNDFHEDDYFYKNNGDGTFTESVKDYFGHLSKFSMGSDVADINHDGYPEIITLDMLPDKESILKSSAGDDNYTNLKMLTNNLGYHYQYSRNMLHVNRNGNYFIECGLMSNIAATDWSWSALFADYNLDGEQDLFIANGIPKRPNDLDYINFISNEDVKNNLNNNKLLDYEALSKMPDGNVQNKFFKGNTLNIFDDVSADWVTDEAFISNGAALADFDNDGDIDIVTNNLNYPSTIYKNEINNNKNYLKVALQSESENTFGIGAKVYAYTNGQLQYKELFPSRGFQSSSEPALHFGLREIKKLDSLLVLWPDKTTTRLYDVNTNNALIINKDSDSINNFNNPQLSRSNLFKKSETFNINYVHKENYYVDFNRQKFIPYKISDKGPATVVGDVNADGKDDIFLGGSKYASGKMYLQNNNSFTESHQETIQNDSICEDEKAILFDIDGNGTNDLYIASGGGEFFGNAKPLLDRLYINNMDGFQKVQLPELFVNTSVVKPNDYDNDGDMDLFIGVSAISNDFGKPPSSYILKNNKGKFVVENILELKNIGMVSDAIWTDFDDDNTKDLIIIGEWMSPVFLKNNEGKFVNVTDSKLNQKYNGLWRAIIPFDIDKDGDLDYLLGNWGLNSKFKASTHSPLKMYYGDFDDNGSTETIIAIKKEGTYYPIKGLNQLSSQLEPLLKKKFTNHKSFAGKALFEVFDENILNKGSLFEVNTLESGYLKNENGTFIFNPFINDLQVSTINCFLKYDFNGDGNQEVLCAGNFFGTEPYHGRLDAFSSALIIGKDEILLGHNINLNFVQKVVNNLNIININNKPYLLASINNEVPEFYEILDSNN